MQELKFKTRGMVNPQGLPRVYFSCHPNDFERYFEMISDEILKKQNCAIFYYGDLTSYDEEELFLDLGQMQLFVMPVTSNLLIKNSRALDVEFKFAMEKHIPVLPLMQESGLEELFNQKCGDLQFLDRNVRDITAISYDEKLEKYLSSVLVGDDLAAKVRAAFDAYVFLSYRKKDRKYAQELMRLIHKNDFCRDIAIWYDEFLTPGENFNDSIKAALEKSELFALVVTPNLVNETNYVMTTEYPMAKQENKLILPAEIVETDKNLLKEKYTDIPDCTDAHDEAALSESLLKAVQAMAIKENDSSPEHNFFIGLAYLSGIDVEVDHERAVALITSAAEAGLPEAMEKLVSMYQNGEGVKRNYETAIEWQERLVEYYKSIFEHTKDKNDGYTLIYEMLYLSDCYNTLHYSKEQKNICKEALEKCKIIRMRVHRRDEVLNSLISMCHRKFGETYLDDPILNYNSYNQAKKQFHKALKEKNIKINGSLAALSADDKIFLSQICNNLGKIEVSKSRNIKKHFLSIINEKKNRYSKSKKLYQKSIETIQLIPQNVEIIDATRTMCDSYCGLGELFLIQGNKTSAVNFYKTSIEIIRKTIENSQAAEDYIYLSDLLWKLSEIDENSNKIKDIFLEFIEINEKLSKDFSFSLSLDRLMLCCEELANISKKSALYKEEKKYILKLLELIDPCDGSYRDNIKRKYIRAYINGYVRLAEIACFDGDLIEAINYYSKLLTMSQLQGTNRLELYLLGIDIVKISNQIFESLKYISNRLNSIQDKMSIAFCYEELYGITGNIEYASTLLTLVKETLKDIRSFEEKQELSCLCENVGDMLATKNISEFREYYGIVLELMLEMMDVLETEQNIHGLERAFIKAGKLSEAKEYFMNALKKAQKITTSETTGILSLYHEKIGNILMQDRNYTDAKEYYFEALRIKLSQNLDTPEVYVGLAEQYYRIGRKWLIDIGRGLHHDPSHGLGRWFIQASYDIYKELSEKYPENINYSIMCDCIKTELYPSYIGEC